MSHISVPIAYGELIDKITILEIKRVRLCRPEACANVEKEYTLLSVIAAPALASEEVAALFEALRRVNEDLWKIEDAIREEEAEARFGPAFVRLARSVYQRNDERAAIKRRINAVLGSELVEEKSYAAAGEEVDVAFIAAPTCSGRPGELSQKSPASSEKQDRSRTRTAGRNLS